MWEIVIQGKNERNLLVLFILMLVLTLVGCKEPINKTNSDQVIKKIMNQNILIVMMTRLIMTTAL